MTYIDSDYETKIVPVMRNNGFECISGEHHEPYELWYKNGMAIDWDRVEGKCIGIYLGSKKEVLVQGGYE